MNHNTSTNHHENTTTPVYIYQQDEQRAESIAELASVIVQLVEQQNMPDLSPAFRFTYFCFNGFTSFLLGITFTISVIAIFSISVLLNYYQNDEKPKQEPSSTPHNPKVLQI